MKQNRKDNQIFGVSFLDVICCSFGAMVLIVLLSKTDVAGGTPDTSKIINLLEDIISEKEIKTATERERELLVEQRRSLETQIEQMEAPGSGLAGLKQQLAEQRAKAKILQTQVGALEKKKMPQRAKTDKVAEVGGIPVDSNHIIFIVDTSGSMQALWPRVIDEIKNVINIHPKVKGFQIMNDNGDYLLQGYAGKWIPDTPGRRKSVLSLMQNWTSFSNSSPVEGLQQALRTYAKRTDNLAIYIFGDDYSGSSYDPVLNTISELNLDRKTGRSIAQIHAIGFFQPADDAGNRFSTLMREVTRRNRGAFVALGPN